MVKFIQVATISSLVIPLHSFAFTTPLINHDLSVLASTPVKKDTSSLEPENSSFILDSVQEYQYELPTKIPVEVDAKRTKDRGTPAEHEKGKFVCHSSVEFWNNYNNDGLYEAQDYFEVARGVSNRFLSKGGDALSYWLRHNARSAYFLSNAAVGTVSSQLYDRLYTKQMGDGTMFSNRLMRIFPYKLADAALIYEQDYENISNGKYKLPYDMYTRNRQQSPLYFGSKSAQFIREAVDTLARRNRGTDEDKRTWLSDSDDTSMYPDYYKTAFHYQTDGWMSQKSADVYETSTETLFFGTQDAMQRTALVSLVEYSNQHALYKDKSETRKPRPIKVLEIGCGTGRFLTFARDNLPLDSEFTAIDLSPFYLNNARDNDRNWMKVRNQRDETVEEHDISPIKPATFVQAKAEDLPFKDGEFDVVICMYLYHEVPRTVRTLISSEMERVTNEGGRVILTDSLQKGDRPFLDKTLGNFGDMNEPFYRDYIEDYLPHHFEKVGLECMAKTLCGNTKTLSFEKNISHLMHPGDEESSNSV